MYQQIAIISITKPSAGKYMVATTKIILRDIGQVLGRELTV